MSESTSPGAVEQSVDRFFAVFERAQAGASIDAVYGQPVPYGEKMILPIASASQAFGLGGGVGINSESDEKANEGVGGGGLGSVRTRPIALAEISGEGVRVVSIVDENRALAAGLAFAAWAVFWTARTLIRIFGNDH